MPSQSPIKTFGEEFGKERTMNLLTPSFRGRVGVG